VVFKAFGHPGLKPGAATLAWINGGSPPLTGADYVVQGWMCLESSFVHGLELNRSPAWNSLVRAR